MLCACRGQAHRADLTTSRIDDDSREPETKKARECAASNDLFLSLPGRLIHGEKKPAQRGGQKVGNTDSSTERGAPNSPSYRFTRRSLVFRYYLLNIAGEAETATLLQNSLVALHGAGCLPVSMSQSTWPALHLQITVSDWSPHRIGGFTMSII
ncbi:hypothetical protein F0330_12945 [Klebsiella pneumoniae]|nr:hypothetical protein F0330_12945 [Klebsiella pneumoniae]